MLSTTCSTESEKTLTSKYPDKQSSIRGDVILSHQARLSITHPVAPEIPIIRVKNTPLVEYALPFPPSGSEQLYRPGGPSIFYYTHGHFLQWLTTSSGNEFLVTNGQFDGSSFAWKILDNVTIFLSKSALGELVWRNIGQIHKGDVVAARMAISSLLLVRDWLTNIRHSTTELHVEMDERIVVPPRGGADWHRTGESLLDEVLPLVNNSYLPEGADTIAVNKLFKNTVVAR